MIPVDVFHVVKEVSVEGVLYLKLEGGRGWLFDHKPGVGGMCVRTEGPQEEPRPPVEFLRPYVTNPVRTYALAGVCHLVLLAIAGILFLTMKTRFLNYSTDVALHLWDNEWFVRNDALTEGNKVCTHNIGTNANQKQQQETRIPAGFFEYDLSIVYTADDGNMLTIEKLQKAKELEDFVVNHENYTKFCLLDKETNKCATPKSALVACDPNLCGSQQLRQGIKTPEEGCGDLTNINGVMRTPAKECSPKKSFPAGIFDCQRRNDGPCLRSQWTIDETFLETKLKVYSQADFPMDTPERYFLFAMDSSFGAGTSTAASIRSEFVFGFPLEGYESTSDRPEEQKEKVEQFMSDAYFKKFNDFNSDNKDIGFKIGYRGGPLAKASVQVLLNGDFAFVAFAFVVVLIFVMFMMGSLFYSIMALAQIFLCFFSGFLMYRVLYGSFFGVFHVMGIFLLLGIGVDGVFVFNDHFIHATQVDESFKGDLLGRLSWTWRKAAIACGVTSLTTATAFFFNATSAFPGIAAFGTFAGCLMIAIYVSMLFFWPAVVVFNEYAIKNMPLAVCLRGTPEPDQEGQSDAKLKTEDSQPAIVKFFANQFSYVILNYRMRILYLFFLVTCFMAYQVTNLVPAKEGPSLLPVNHPVNQFMIAMKEHFLRGGSQFNTKVMVQFGLGNPPIDRTGTDNTGTGYGASADEVGTRGKIEYNPNFMLADGDENWGVILGGFDCVIQLCDSAEVKDSKRHTGGLPSFKVSGCFPRDLQQHLNKHNGSAATKTWNAILGGSTADFLYTMMEKARMDDDFLGELRDSTYSEKVDENTVHHRYSVFEVKLTSSKSLEFEVGNELAANWEAWLQDQMGKGKCQGKADQLTPFVVAKDFHQFKVSETLMGEMQRGVITSISVALVALVLVTGNYIIGSVAAFGIGLIVLWVMAMIPMMGWELGIVENIILVMVPGLSVDFTAHMAESYNQSKSDDRDERVREALEHSGVSIISGAISTSLAGLCLCACQISFFVSFGTLLLFTIIFAVLFSLFFFPSAMSLFGPVGDAGDWHKLVCKKQAEGQQVDMDDSKRSMNDKEKRQFI